MSADWSKIHQARSDRADRRLYERVANEQRIIDHEMNHLKILGKGEFIKITNEHNVIIGGVVPLFDPSNKKELATQIASAEMPGASSQDKRMASYLKNTSFSLHERNTK